MINKNREGKNIAITLTILCCVATGLPKAFTDSGAKSIFMSEIGVDYLPVSYIIGAAILPVLGRLYEWVSRHFSLIAVNSGTAAINVAGALIVWLALTRFQSPISAWMGVLWYQIEWVLSGLVTWTLASRMLNLREGQKYFGWIAIGGLMAQGVGGLLVDPVATHFGSANLFLVSATGSLLAVAVLAVLGKRYGHRLIETIDPLEALSATQSSQRPSRYKYRKWLYVLLIGQSISMYYVNEFIYFGIVEKGIPDENEMAVFLGRFAAAEGFLSVLLSALAGTVIARAGMMVSMGLLPVVTAITGLVIAVVLMLQQDITTLTLLVAAATLLGDVLLRYTIDKQVGVLLFQPLPAEERTRLQVLGETTVEPSAGALSGLALLGIAQFTGDYAVTLSIILLITLALVRLGIGIAAIREFRRLLARAIERRDLLPPDLQGDKRNLDAVADGLWSGQARRALYGIEMTRRHDVARLRQALPDLLDFPNMAVRAAALEAVADDPRGQAVELLEHLLHEDDPALAVRSAALIDQLDVEGETLEPAPWPLLRRCAEDPAAPTQRAALAALLAHGPFEDRIAMAMQLRALCQSPLVADRLAATEIIAATGRTDLEGALLPLIGDQDVMVRQHALAAATKLHSPRLAKALVEGIRTGLSGRQTALKLAGFGNKAVGPILRALDSDPNRAVVRLLHTALAVIGTPAALARLQQDLIGGDLDRRHSVGLALFGRLITVSDRSACWRQVERELDLYDQLMQWRRDTAQEPRLAALHRCLREISTGQRDHLARLIALGTDAGKYGQAIETVLAGADSAKVAIAIEFFQYALPRELRQRLLRVLETAAPAVNHDPPDGARVIDAILTVGPQATGVWLQTMAVYGVGTLELTELAGRLEPLYRSPDAHLAETARWAGRRIGCQPSLTEESVHAGG